MSRNCICIELSRLLLIFLQKQDYMKICNPVFYYLKQNNLHKFIHLIRIYRYPNTIWIIISLLLLYFK